jgi:hypothetical protein
MSICAICRDPLQSGVDVVVAHGWHPPLTASDEEDSLHRFHQSCLQGAVNHGISCPLCRAPITALVPESGASAAAAAARVAARLRDDEAAARAVQADEEVLDAAAAAVLQPDGEAIAASELGDVRSERTEEDPDPFPEEMGGLMRLSDEDQCDLALFDLLLTIAPQSEAAMLFAGAPTRVRLAHAPQALYMAIDTVDPDVVAALLGAGANPNTIAAIMGCSAFDYCAMVIGPLERELEQIALGLRSADYSVVPLERARDNLRRIADYLAAFRGVPTE